MTKLDWDRAKRPKEGTASIAGARERPWVPPEVQQREAEERAARQRVLTQRSQQRDDELLLAQLRSKNLAWIKEKRANGKPLSEFDKLIVKEWLDEG